ncbi:MULTISPECIES: DUF3226 domain-containing protein [unclassified Imperialibacter]|uniref:DUF3226 domain-containing protein n=1 Tax=unclassified Imperialibacter TaxID=2629706 RepID=UPI0012518841|nr:MULTISPECIES: DUF3226 domain-containing protein [unclassified Imperialibacter]CAD5271341.1 hypothetical protein IMPERIA75_370100 [Imperialibacter sp. 75]CAD5298421.1 hypothetical protein IMPERIA89_740006 [Imperialibacter sp. 89]VVT35621.1 hypothetical protein IMPR6_90090 [Imperialibacter sp. EC-SDR9]
MKDTYIFVEGDTDEKFLQAIFLRHYSDGDRVQFISLGGNYKRLEEKKRVEQLKDGRRNLIIVDADVNNFNQVKSGVQVLLDRIAEEQERLNIPFQADSFLFPNDILDGNLESLVRNLAPLNKSDIWNCIDGYSKCVEQIQTPGFRAIDAKTKIYIYVNAHDHVKWNAQEWLLDTEIWNLESNSLDNLLAFLDKYFTRNQ